MKFEIGDIVKFTKASPFRSIHECEGKIIATYDYPETQFDILYKVLYKNDEYPCYSEEMEHTKIANTKTARKLYPYYKEDGEWLIKKSL